MSDAVYRLGGVSAPNSACETEATPAFQPGSALGRLLTASPVDEARGDGGFAPSLPYALLTQFAQGFWQRLAAR